MKKTKQQIKQIAIQKAIATLGRISIGDLWKLKLKYKFSVFIRTYAGFYVKCDFNYLTSEPGQLIAVDHILQSAGIVHITLLNTTKAWMK